VAIHADRNVVLTEAEVKLKYKSLCTYIQRTWNLKCKIIPVLNRATGIVTKGLRKNLEAVLGKRSIDSVQKTAVLGTSHIIRKVVQSENWSLNGGDHRWFKSTSKKSPVTRDNKNNIIIIIIITATAYTTTATTTSMTQVLVLLLLTRTL
jgi:hypothetical protein